MSNVFFVSDTHFGHANIMSFFKRDGVTPLRPFVDIKDHDNTIVENWNRVIGPKDIVWHLGDVAIPRRGLAQVKRLNGRKKLILGNHDPFVKNQNRDYFEAGFESCEAFHKFDRFVATHVPVHPACLRPSWPANVHGHTHDNLVVKTIRHSDFSQYGRGNWTTEEPDKQYINVCMEHINYTPISMEEICARLA